MSLLNHLPLLSQLTAQTSEKDDPVESYRLNSLEVDSKLVRPLYALEFFMGINYGELRLEKSPNTVHVRSSIKRLLQDQKLALIPTEETLDKLLKLHSQNLECEVYARTRYRDVLPHQEYEYLVRSFDLKEPLSIISHDGSRHTYTPPHDNLPHFRSTAHPFLVVRNAASTLFAAALRRLPVKDVKVMVIRSKWYKAPPTFAQKPDWKELGHPLDRVGDPVEEILAPRERNLPGPDIGYISLDFVHESSSKHRVAAHGVHTETRDQTLGQEDEEDCRPQNKV
ncbi:hypothetical protein Moror_11526 [Moniliophthora roreri MCA 2997]|uniref:Uncharacterized protein n=2 Tax=Moniliophthora roreri TaxID=221103 RepID=V2WB38_MONRO|nr:hypothetical protein Moror_11526 [Moniliophthora roreri MCA 2997]KAI3596449.1 hypothetical protein WG66_003206 [Moniliophthora roreri]